MLWVHIMLLFQVVHHIQGTERDWILVQPVPWYGTESRQVEPVQYNRASRHSQIIPANMDNYFVPFQVYSNFYHSQNPYRVSLRCWKQACIFQELIEITGSHYKLYR